MSDSPARVVEIAVDYGVRWPVKVDHMYTSEIRRLLDPATIDELSDLAEWWHEAFAAIPDDFAHPPPDAVIDEWLHRLDHARASLQRDLGPGFIVA
jgi:hypothetical protein